MLNRELIQREFPFPDGTIYVDTCQIGLPPLRARQVSNRFMDGYVDTAISGGDFGFGETRAKVRDMLAQLIGGNANEIAFTKNTTEGLSILAMGYPLGPGYNVVTCDLENPANLYPWFNAAAIRGFEVRVAKTREGRVTVDDVANLVDKHTKIVALSAVQAGTGTRADLAALGELCHKQGAILAVDAIQALGRMHLDVGKTGVGFLSCGGYKGLMAGFGVGFLWCQSALIEQIRPPYAGPQSAQSFMIPPAVTPDASGFALRSDAARFEAGTHNSYGIALLESSVGLLLELGPQEIQRHILAIEDVLRGHLEGSPMAFVAPDSPMGRSGIVVGYYPPEKHSALAAKLAEEKVVLTHREGYVRLALSFYNTEAQMKVVADVLNSVGRP